MLVLYGSSFCNGNVECYGNVLYIIERRILLTIQVMCMNTPRDVSSTHTGVITICWIEEMQGVCMRMHWHVYRSIH